MRKVYSLLLGTILLVGAGLAPASEAWAQSRPSRPATVQQTGRDAPVAGKVSVDMMVIYAHNEDNRVDPELRAVMKNLKNLRFSGYRLLERHPGQLGVGQESQFSIPGGRKIKVELLDRTESQAKVRIRMFKGSDKVLDTTVSIHRNRSFLIGGPDYEKGKLILPVTVRY